MTQASVPNIDNATQAKLFASGYSSLDALKKDLNLMFDNAKIYNEQDSQIYKDANTLHKIVQEFEGTEPPKAVAVTNGRSTHKRSITAAATAADGTPDPKMEDAMMKIVDGLLNTVDEKYITCRPSRPVRVHAER